MKRLITFLITLLLCTSLAHAGAEYVTVVKILSGGDKGIIERQNGERWLIEKGIGAISFWLFEGKNVIIYSPGLFCGIGSKIILPERDQEARILNAELIESNDSSSLITSLSDQDISTIALTYLGYYDPQSNDPTKQDIIIALKTFQVTKNLDQDGLLSLNTQLALANAISEIEPQTQRTLLLRFALLKSAERLMVRNTPSLDGIETFIISVSRDGSIIKLADGFIYEIDSFAKIKTALWLPSQRVLRLDHELLNLDNGVKVIAFLIKE